MTKFIGIAAAAALASSTGLMERGRVNGPVKRLAHDHWSGDPAQNDTVSLGFYDWDTLLDPQLSVIEFDDYGTSVTLDVGDVTYPAALVSGQDIAAAAGTVSPLKSVTIANRRKPLWEMLGYATIKAAQAVGPRCELLASFKGANPTAGALGWSIYGSAQ